jgi:hypothetical protein
MYVIMYMTPINRRTSQRVFVAREIPWCGKGFGSGIGI